MFFPFFGLFLVFILIVTYFLKKSIRTQNQTDDDFWAREREANHVRRRDISGLPYIIIPLEKFSIGISEDAGLHELTEKLEALSKKKILNLGSQTNTDLKLQFGPANLNDLTEYDQNFAELVPLLVSYAERLIQLGYEAEAAPVLEFGVSCGSDNSKNYCLLADFYKNNGMPEKISELKERASGLDSLMKQPILEKLEKIAAS